MSSAPPPLSEKLDGLGLALQGQSALSRVLLFLVGFILTTVLFTFIQSTLQSWPAERGRGMEPPVVPHYIPYLQHLPGFLWNPGHIYRSNSARYPNSPFTLLMMNTKFHVFQSPSTIHHIFSRSRQFAFEPVLASMMENGINLPPKDLAFFQLPPRMPQSKPPVTKTSDSFISQNHNIWLKYLVGPPLDSIMAVYGEKFREVLASHLHCNSREPQPARLHETMSRLIFETSVLTFFGPRLAEYWADMWEDWKLYNAATYVGVRANAYYRLRPGAYGARERMLRAFENWTEHDLGEWSPQADCWSETWGAKLNWEREHIARKHGFSLRGRAGLHASFLFVIVVNAAPMASWFTWLVASSPDRLERFRRETTSTLKDGGGGRNAAKQLHFDSSAIKSNQYLQGLWKEALRLGSANAAARVVMEDVELEGYLVTKGSVILMPVQLIHFNKEVFVDPDEFLPERWIVDDSQDGEQIEQQKKQNSSLRTFGGGTGLCSGRFMAEQEIITVVSTLLLLFDIEWDGCAEKMFAPNPRNLGIMEPKKDPVVRFRRIESRL